MDIALQVVYKRTGKGDWVSRKGPSWNTQRYAGGKGGKDATRGGQSLWQRGNGKKGGNGTETGGKGNCRTCWTCARSGHSAASTPKKNGNKNVYAVGEGENVKSVKKQLTMRRNASVVLFGRA